MTVSLNIPIEIEQFLSKFQPCPERIYNLSGSLMALFLALREKPFLMVDSDEESAENLYRDILFYRQCAGKSGGLVHIPSPDSITALAERARSVIAITEKASVVAGKEALAGPLWLPEDLEKHIIRLRISSNYSRDVIAERLIEMGYMQSPLVTEKGQFSLRQWVLDVFPPAEERPVRVEFFGDTIESIRRFEIEGQRSTEEIDEIDIYPSKEPHSGPDIFSLCKDYERFCSEAIAEDMPSDIRLLTRFAIAGGGTDAGAITFRGLGILHEERKDIGELAASVKTLSAVARVMFVSSSTWQAERLKEILKDGGVIAPIVEAQDTFAYSGQVFITIGELSAGFYIHGLAVLTERELFRRPPYRAIKRSKVSGLLASLDDLKEGDYIVHKDYGIGRFTGLVRQSIEGYECDLMSIEYKDGARLYVPLENIGKITKYHYTEGATPALDALGTKSWQKTKEKVRRKVKDLAERLLKLYAERQVARGFAFSEDTEVHREFDRFFQYEETPDQIRAIEEIKKDMTADRPMDRLLCGDVGYGKTEVAMRAAFRAVYDGRQVAVIVPTTLLCEQHTRTFRERFSAFPVRIDYLSRFKTKEEQRKTLAALASGEIDIIIGTHALLRKDVSFSNLGLLIIDEEHRFGVAQKEKLKELKKGVDVLSLSATPIPRTLQMALSGIRAMSLIETPPEERLAVKTTVSVFNPEIIKQAISYEIERDGSVFFVHNRIKDILKMAEYLRGLLPELRLEVAHGQTPEHILEDIMLRFIDGKIDVLVCTAIIGSGLDIPNANTIIINMADKMGLADLYQLRGRVGRGKVRAYAYFLISPPQTLTKEAAMRLQAIQELSYLGAGLRLAMKDLEIRGAGNLLGPEQSGYMKAVGFDMYIELIEEAVAELKGQKMPEKVETRLSLSVNALLPEDYIGDIILRLSAYRKIASAENIEAIDSIRAEFKDRFGPLPEEAETLLKISSLKLHAERLRLASIIQDGSKLKFTFHKGTGITAERLLDAFRGDLRFFPEGFEIYFKGDIIKAVSEALDRLESLN